MKTCLSFSDILQVSRPQISEMQRIGDLYPDASAPGACEAFARQTRLVEGIVVQTYGIAAVLAKRADRVQEAAEVWNQMSRFCHVALQALESQKHKYPDCGTPGLYDLVLDYKLAADKRYTGALEEESCQKKEFPKGLFPKLN